MPYYLDTSFAGIALFPQQGPPERRNEYARVGKRAANIIRSALDDADLYSSALIDVELTHVVHHAGLPSANIDSFLSYLRRVRIDAEVIQRARTLTKALRSLDAIHLASALILDSPTAPVTLLTHDRRMSIAAAAHGLTVVDLLEDDAGA
ncbi:PIN domain-containing protein [Actinomyces trachealis]|uniref:PIN domain-containing protein n=1 Tax=Actinomyces trachealis TaxID=2763540 RepID=UPI001892A73F|nr:PIN domain-containing protein [Actinomyces trachealis]